MEIKYVVTHEDNWFFLKYLLKNNTLMRRNYLTNFICTILVTPLLLGLMYYGNLITNLVKLIFLFIFTEVLMIWWYLGYPKRQMLKLSKSNEGLLGEYHMEISPEGVRESKLKKEVFIPWSDIKQIDQDVNSIYILTSETGGFIIPKRSFSKEVVQDIYNEVLKCYRDAGTNAS